MEIVRKIPAIKLINVSYSYFQRGRAVNQVSLSIGSGEKTALIGPNGAGKSTLLTILNGILPAEGLIEIGGTVLEKKTLRLIRSKVGIVFQNPEDQLFCPKLYDDIAFGPQNFGLSEKEVASRVKQALAETGLSGFEDRSPIQLSFGEKKLASIATIVSCNPEIIALDEPTSNLDPFHRRKIIEWINRSDKTIFLTSHDLDFVAETCQRVLIMDNGNLVADGGVADILTNRDLLESHLLELPLSLKKWPFEQKSDS